MQAIHIYMPETNHASRVMFFYISTLQSMCAVISTAVYCSCLSSCCPGMLLRYFLQEFDMVPVAPIIILVSLLIF
jgi:hypothetical protein